MQKDGRIVDAIGRVRNLDREAMTVLIAEFIARGMMSRHRDGAILYGTYIAAWQPDKDAGEPGVCSLTLQGKSDEYLDEVEALLDGHEISVLLIDSFTNPPERHYLIKLKPPKQS